MIISPSMFSDLSETSVIWMLNFLDWLSNFISIFLFFCFLFLSYTISLSFCLAVGFLQCFLLTSLLRFFVFLFSKLLLGHWISFLVMSFFPPVFSISSLTLLDGPLHLFSLWNVLPSDTCIAYSLNSFRSMCSVIIYLKLQLHSHT